MLKEKPWLQSGDHSLKVQLLQNILSAMGLNTGGTDGIYGKYTKTAIISVLRLKLDGSYEGGVGENTWYNGIMSLMYEFANAAADGKATIMGLLNKYQGEEIEKMNTPPQTESTSDSSNTNESHRYYYNSDKSLGGSDEGKGNDVVDKQYSSDGSTKPWYVNVKDAIIKGANSIDEKIKAVEREQYNDAVKFAQDNMRFLGRTPENTSDYYEQVDEFAQKILDAQNIAVGMSSEMKIVGEAQVKPINLPSWKKVSVDMEHIISGHTASGTRAVQSSIAGKGKDIFSNMTEDQIEKAVRQAYRYGEKLESQGDRVFMSGSYGGLTIQMWVNKVTNTIETAWTK